MRGARSFWANTSWSNVPISRLHRALPVTEVNKVFGNKDKSRWYHDNFVLAYLLCKDFFVRKE